MEPIEFGDIEKSISILVNEIWQSPDWVVWYEDELNDVGLLLSTNRLRELLAKAQDEAPASKTSSGK
jgi:hypothetical protein